MNVSSASSSICVIGYTLQSIASGAPGLKSIVWSHVLLGRNCWDSSLLNTFANALYSLGISTFFVYCWVATASSTEVFHIAGGSPPTSCSNSATILSHSSVDKYLSTTSLLLCGLIVCSTMGRLLSSIVPCFQLKRGLYVDSQGYPRRMSSLPMSMIRNLISCVLPAVVMARDK
jgi:hypothetical protein